MFWRSTPLLPVLVALGLLLNPVSGLAGSALAPPGGQASATLNFRIVIPPVMRVLENSHPPELQTGPAGRLSGEQRLVVVSNLKRGFCVTLRQAEPEVNAWRLQTAQEGGVTLVPVSDGYRLCTARPGRYTLLLQHEFDTAAGSDRTALRWPVQTDLTAM